MNPILKLKLLRRKMMPKYIVKRVHITYTEVEAESREQAEEFSVHEDARTTEEYVEVEEDEEDWV